MASSVRKRTEVNAGLEDARITTSIAYAIAQTGPRAGANMLAQVLRIKRGTSRRYFGEHIRNFSLINQYNDDHGPAYGFGVDARGRYPGRDFDDVEAEMSRDWVASRGASILSWEWARHAARDAWNRISQPS